MLEDAEFRPLARLDTKNERNVYEEPKIIRWANLNPQRPVPQL